MQRSLHSCLLFLYFVLYVFLFLVTKHNPSVFCSFLLSFAFPRISFSIESPKRPSPIADKRNTMLCFARETLSRCWLDVEGRRERQRRRGHEEENARTRTGENAQGNGTKSCAYPRQGKSPWLHTESSPSDLVRLSRVGSRDSTSPIGSSTARRVSVFSLPLLLFHYPHSFFPSFHSSTLALSLFSLSFSFFFQLPSRPTTTLYTAPPCYFNRKFSLLLN